jgi:hypothetical protein
VTAAGPARSSFPGATPASIPTPVNPHPSDPIRGLRRLLVAGTAGGVGTTTVAALLFAELRDTGDAPFLIDHTGGDLGPRLPGGDEVTAVDHRFRLHDLGRNVGVAAAELADPGTSLIMVTAATPLGRTLAAEQLRLLGQPGPMAGRSPGQDGGWPHGRDDGRPHGQDDGRPNDDHPGNDHGDQRPDQGGDQNRAAQVVVVQVECFGRRQRRPVPDAGARARDQLLLPVDDVLAAGGRIPYNRLARQTRQAIRRLAAAVRADLGR